ncbi:hypothetical protein CEXT_388561 [Caerostris extrusa]|uniref:Uncharacterized protein n=1 Tax=Caerostris extrusa TaxID=172846 RepID=A0AAV4WAU1_CAEEX|nr:hypothetical protein CEXT_388561 [Caerostris extrusa]
MKPRTMLNQSHDLELRNQNHSGEYEFFFSKYSFLVLDYEMLPSCCDFFFFLHEQITWYFNMFFKGAIDPLKKLQIIAGYCVKLLGSKVVNELSTRDQLGMGEVNKNAMNKLNKLYTKLMAA